MDRAREWLETNGTGDYASGTLAWRNTRRFHGLLVIAQEHQHEPVGHHWTSVLPARSGCG